MSNKEKVLSEQLVDKTEELTVKIDRYVELRCMVNEHKRLGAEIKEWLDQNHVAEVKSVKGNIARLNPGKPGKKFFTWSIDKLQSYLKPRLFKLVCPPTPDTVPLDQMLKEDLNLLKCGEWDSAEPGKPTLEILEAA